jgi:protein-tyrosine phosphatase
LVDIHCHTLSRIDDGAENSTMMKKMIDTAFADGIRTICFTPHFKIYEFRNEQDVVSYNKLIEQIFKIAIDYKNQNYPDMQMYLGNEIMYHNDFFDSLQSKNCRSLNNSSYVLVEFQPSVTSYDLRNSISRILRKGYIPLIAHIERYGTLVKNYDLLLELKSLGALFQVNARSITKIKFGKTSSFLRKVLKQNLIDVIATDAHDNSSFPQNLSKAYFYISKHFGDTYAKKLFCDIPTAILNNEKTI